MTFCMVTSWSMPRGGSQPKTANQKSKYGVTPWLPCPIFATRCKRSWRKEMWKWHASSSPGRSFTTSLALRVRAGSFRMDQAVICHLRGDKIVEAWEIADVGALVDQVSS